MYFCYRKVLLLSLLLLLFVSLCSCSWWSEPQHQSNTHLSIHRRRMLEEEVQKEHQNVKKTNTQSTKNQTKLIKPNSSSSKNQTKTLKSNNLNSSKNQTKTIKSNNLNSSKNQTKTIKTNNNSTKTVKSSKLSSSKNQTNVSSKSASSKPTPSNTTLKKLNSTTNPKLKKLNSTSTKKTLDLVKASNKTTKATTDKNNKNQTKTQTHETNKNPKKQTPPSYTLKKEQHQEEDDDEDDDFVSLSEFKDLPNRFHRTLLPDLERISTTSKAYITEANYQMTKGFKPYVGKKYAPTIATLVSSIFVLIPLLLVSLLCNKIKTYFSLQKILIFVQIYLSLYFTTLCISTLITGVEPLKFLFTTSQSTYICLQVLQTLGYVFYLLLLVMYLVLVFSTECGLGSKFLGLGQIFVGFSVGLHYYVTVFHKVVLRQPPKSNWKIHGIYATCFLLICLFAGADRRKKAYVENDGEEGKKN